MGEPRITHVALLAPHPSVAAHPLVVALVTWLEATCRERRLPLQVVPPSDALGAVPGLGARAQAPRQVAAALAQRFPQLARLCQPAQGIRRFLPTPRERYWHRMFLALAAALAVKRELVLREAPRDPSPSPRP